MANGMRMILLVLVPAAAAILVLSEPMVRLVYERGDFCRRADADLSAEALFWFAFSLPVQRPLPDPHPHVLQPPAALGADRISLINLAITAAVCAALYEPFGVGGIVAATAIATLASVVAQMSSCAASSAGSSSRGCSTATVRITFASAVLAGVAYLVWDVLDDALGDWHARPDRLAGRRAARRAASSTSARSWRCGCPRRGSSRLVRG